MRLPGTRYQEHGWEQVRKLLGLCSLHVLRQWPADQAFDASALDWYVDATCAALRAQRHGARADAPGNSYGESVLELALALVCELRLLPNHWEGLVAAFGRDGGMAGAAEGMLRKKVNDMYAGVRDKVDADNYQVATGRACSPNKIYTYRMLDTAYHDISVLFADWRQHAAQVAAILGRDVAGIPIEARQLKSIAGCKADWLIRWSATLEQFAGAPGPLHTKSKRFSSLKNSPEKIALMLAEIGDYEQLSANMDSADDWHGEAGAAALWLEDYWQVMNAPEPAPRDDQLLAADDEDEAVFVADEAPAPADATEPPAGPHDSARAIAVSLPPGYLAMAGAAQQRGSWALQILQGDTLAIRLAVYQKLLGSVDDSYPDAWCDPATGELPTLQQLAGLDAISMPTLRKRRNDAIARLQAAQSRRST